MLHAYFTALLISLKFPEVVGTHFSFPFARIHPTHAYFTAMLISLSFLRWWELSLSFLILLYRGVSSLRRRDM